MGINAILKTIGIQQRIYQTNPLAGDPRGPDVPFIDGEDYGTLRHECDRLAFTDGTVTHMPFGHVRNHPMNHGFQPGIPIHIDQNKINLRLLFGPPGSGKSKTMSGQGIRSIQIAEDTPNRNVIVIVGKPERYETNTLLHHALRARLDVKVIDNTGVAEISDAYDPDDYDGQTAVFNRWDQKLKDELLPAHYADLLLRCYGQHREVGTHGQDFFTSMMGHGFGRILVRVRPTSPDHENLIRALVDDEYAKEVLHLSDREIENARHALVNIESDNSYSAVVSRDNYERKGLGDRKDVIDQRVDWLDLVTIPGQFILVKIQPGSQGTLIATSLLEGLLAAAQHLGRSPEVINDVYLDDTVIPPKSLAKFVATSRSANIRLTVAMQTANQLDVSVRDTILGMANVTQDFGSSQSQVQKETMGKASPIIQMATPTMDVDWLVEHFGIKEDILLHPNIFSLVANEPNTNIIRINGIPGHPLNEQTLLTLSPAYYPKRLVSLLEKMQTPELPGHFHPRYYPDVVNKNAVNDAIEKLRDEQAEQLKKQEGSRRDRDEKKEKRSERQQEELLMRLMAIMGEQHSEHLRALEKMLRDVSRKDGQQRKTNGQKTSGKKQSSSAKTTERKPQSKNQRRTTFKRSSPEDIDPTINTEPKREGPKRGGE